MNHIPMTFLRTVPYLPLTWGFWWKYTCYISSSVILRRPHKTALVCIYMYVPKYLIKHSQRSAASRFFPVYKTTWFLYHGLIIGIFPRSLKVEDHDLIRNVFSGDGVEHSRRVYKTMVLSQETKTVHSTISWNGVIDAFDMTIVLF